MTEIKEQAGAKWFAGVMLAMLVLGMGQGIVTPVPVYAEEAPAPDPAPEPAPEPEPEPEPEVQGATTEEKNTSGEEGQEGADGAPLDDTTPAENGENGAPNESGENGEGGTSGESPETDVNPNDGPGVIDTGNGTSTVEVDTTANDTSVDTDAPAASSTPQATSTPQGPPQGPFGGGGGNGSSASTTIDIAQEVNSTTAATSTTDTGNNEVADHPDSVIGTGHGLASTRVNERFNIVKIDSEANEIELFYDPAEQVIDFLGQVKDFFNPLPPVAGNDNCSALGCVPDKILLNVTQKADVNQILVGDCNSGLNLGGDMASGNCTAVVISEVKANWVALNSNLAVLKVANIGDVNADIMLPEPEFFENLRGGSVARGSDLTIEQNATSSCTGAGDANSGGNALEQGLTGGANSKSTCTNFVNQINPPSCFIVSVSGAWTGEIYQLPRGFESQETPFGTVICGRGTGTGDAKAYSGVIKQDLQTVVDAVAKANTGYNDGSTVITGNAEAIIEALNVSNQVFINEDWVLGLFTVVGDWNGDLMFGPRPEPTPAEQVAGQVLSKSVKKKKASKQVSSDVELVKTSSVSTVASPGVVEYTLTLKNKGKKMTNALLEDVLTDPLGNAINTQKWELGTIESDEEIVVKYSVEFKGALMGGEYVNAARLTGKINSDPIKPVFTSTAVTLLGGEVLGAAECPAYLTGYVTTFGKNDPEQVRLLEVFLRDGRGEQITPDGLYDALSVAAVKKFQAENINDILVPWGIDYPTGNVYYTTRKKINELYCNNEKAFPLTPLQSNQIELYRNGVLQPIEGAPIGPVPSLWQWSAAGFPVFSTLSPSTPVTASDSFLTSPFRTHSLLTLLYDIFSQIAASFSVETAQAAENF